MSLINQMLKDLEQRNAVTFDSRRPLSGEVRTAWDQRRSWLLPLLGGVLIVLTGVTYLWTQHLLVIPSIGAKEVQVAPPKPIAVTPVAKTSPVPTATPADAPVLPRTPQPESSQPAASSPEPNTYPMSLLERELRTSPSEQLAQESAPEKPARPAKPSVKSPGKPTAEPGDKLTTGTTKAKMATKPSATGPLAGKHIRSEQKSENFYHQAQLYLQQGRVAESQALLEQALVANPANHDARQTLAGLLVDNKRNGEALTLLRTGLELAPEQSGFSLALSRLQLDAGNNAGALAILEQGLPYAKNDADYHGFLAALLQRNNRHDEAINHYQIALAGNSTTPNWLIGLGISFQATERLEEAQQVFQRAQNSANLSPELAQFVDQRLKQIRQRLR